MIQDKAKSGAEMKRSLGWFQLMCMGIGAIIGSGIFGLVSAPLYPAFCYFLIDSIAPYQIPMVCKSNHEEH